MEYDFPETRDSLIVQLRDPLNREAWEQFASIYRYNKWLHTEHSLERV